MKSKNILNFILTAALAFILFINFNLSAQNQIDSLTNQNPNLIDTSQIPEAPGYAPRDTFHFRYNFEVGDSLTYIVMSNDSVIVDYGSPLLRIRFEKILITCDSITKAGNFCLTQKLIEFSAKESDAKEKNVSRETSDWLNIPVYLEIDTLGRRIKTANPDFKRNAVTVGGAFQSYLLVTLDTNENDTNGHRKLTNESWLVSGVDDLVENAMPIPRLKYMTLFRMIGAEDTLDFKNLIRINTTITGQGLFDVYLDSNNRMSTHTRIASGGKIYLDTINWIPVVMQNTMEQRLTFYNDGKEYPGRHRTNTTYILDRFVRKSNVINTLIKE
jgi:hypothetical protein